LLNIIILIVIKVTFTLNKYFHFQKKFHFQFDATQSMTVPQGGAAVIIRSHDMCHWTRKYFGVTRAHAPLTITSHHNHAADRHTTLII